MKRTDIAPQLQALNKHVDFATLLHSLGSMKNNVRMTHVETLERKTGVDGKQIREFFTKLEGLKCGTLKLGRHGSRTRFVWDVPLTEVAAFALNAASKKGKPFDPEQTAGWVPDIEEEPEPEPESPWQEFLIPLAGDRVATLKAPKDLSRLDFELIEGYFALLKKRLG